MNKYLQAIREFLNKLIDKNTPELLKVFKVAMNEIIKEINNLLIEFVTDGKIDVPRKKRYELVNKLNTVLNKQAKIIGQKDVEVTTKILNETTTNSFYRTAFMIEAGLASVLNVNPLKTNEIKAIVNTPINEEMFSDRIWKNKQKLVKQVKYSVERAMINGDDPRKLAKQVKDIFGVSAYESKRLISNEVARVSRQAQDQAYEKSGVVKEVMFDATLDSKTSKYCRAHDGKIYKFGEHPRIPEDTHVGCRSDIVPVIKGWKPKFKKDNETKEIIPYKQYNDWAKDKGYI
ncbi:minor capsid protein [Priestia megaterium]|uniref:minor capsid protein n=1 Tax=Priestia megaterium TaxID=1404 RepID=UPI003CC5367B